MILIRNQLKRYLYASMYFGYERSLLLVRKQIVDDLVVKRCLFAVARSRL